MKKHDPNRKRDYGCEICGRSFGRRTDLKRHIDSIHHGTRRFGCEQCGRRFTRQDTLTRHCADGCRRKQRKSQRSENPTGPWESIHSYPSPPSAVESQRPARHSESSTRSYAMRTFTRPNKVNASCTVSDT
ncbi:hypothetical protein VTN00DRAFT_7548 [Thermoascus crustaceus]|uniref:uncharacterized protein n=1 Tax=Thermoascus crustaceus TaxID=5088 RepID=UPI0037447C15